MEQLFEHDPVKSRGNRERHGVTLEEAQELWEETHVIIPTKNVSGESRYAIVGLIRGRFYVAIFMRRGAAIRLISCHRADRRWERIYETYTEKGG